MHTFRYSASIAAFCLSFFDSCAAQVRANLPLPPTSHLNHVDGQPILLPLRLGGGEELLFMLDTGSRFTILDRSLEPKLGRRIGTKTMRYNWYTGKTGWGIYPAPELSSGGVPLRMGKRVFTDDLTRIWPGRPMMGILGMDCLWHYCIQLDFVVGEIRFLDPEHLDAARLGQAFPLRSLWGAVTTRMDFFDRKGQRFLLDTPDYTDGALCSELFRLALEKQSAVWIRQGKNPDGTRGRVAYLQECRLGLDTYTNLVFKDCSVGALSNHNMLGLRFLGRHLVTLNFPKKVMYLRTTNYGPRKLESLPAKPNKAMHSNERAVRGAGMEKSRYAAHR